MRLAQIDLPVIAVILSENLIKHEQELAITCSISSISTYERLARHSQQSAVYLLFSARLQLFCCVNWPRWLLLLTEVLLCLVPSLSA